MDRSKRPIFKRQVQPGKLNYWRSQSCPAGATVPLGELYRVVHSAKKCKKDDSVSSGSMWLWIAVKSMPSRAG